MPTLSGQRTVGTRTAVWPHPVIKTTGSAYPDSFSGTPGKPAHRLNRVAKCIPGSILNQMTEILPDPRWISLGELRQFFFIEPIDIYSGVLPQKRPFQSTHFRKGTPNREQVTGKDPLQHLISPSFPAARRRSGDRLLFQNQPGRAIPPINHDNDPDGSDPLPISHASCRRYPQPISIDSPITDALPWLTP